MNNFVEFFKLTILLILLFLIYAIFSSNFIVLSKIFSSACIPEFPKCKKSTACDETNQVEEYTILDYLFPTNLTLPPYASCKTLNSAESISVKKSCNFNEGCGYSSTQIINSLKKTLQNAIQNGDFENFVIEWPYNYFQLNSEKLEGVKNQDIPWWDFISLIQKRSELNDIQSKQSIALVILNQSYFVRKFLKLYFKIGLGWKYWPDFLLMAGGPWFILIYIIWLAGLSMASFLWGIGNGYISGVVPEECAEKSLFNCTTAMNDCNLAKGGGNYFNLGMQLICIGGISGLG